MTLMTLIKRNVKMFFKDKGMLFTSLITPIILLVLYSTFLAEVYHDSFIMSVPEVILSGLPETLIDGLVGSQLTSSLLAVTCVTVAFCSNMLMVQDLVSGARKDLTTSPVKKSTLALAYYIATFITTFIIGIIAAGACFIYIACVGWYLSFVDVLLILLDVVLLTLFGTALSAIVNCFLTSQGQISAVGTVVSAGYGFICGAYMPISQFGEGLQKVISFFPGTYGTSLFREHTLNGVFKELPNYHFPDEVIEGIKDSIDVNIYFFDNQVSTFAKYLVMVATIASLVGIYVLINKFKKRKK